MKKVYEIAYSLQKEDVPTLLFAEVCADNTKQAREIFYRYHDKESKIVQLKFKRKWR